MRQLLAVTLVLTAAPLAAQTATPPQAAPGVQAPNDTTVPPPSTIGWVRAGQTRRGNLENNDFRMGDGTWADVWYLEATASQRIEITVNSTAFTPYVQLLDPYGNKLTESPSLTFTLPSAGRFQIVINSQGSDLKTGPYTVAIAVK